MKSLSALIFFIAGVVQANSTINATNKWAYGSNIAWVNAEADVTNGAQIGEFFSSGFLYSANVGWIHLGNGTPDNGIAYSNGSATDYGVNTDASGNLRGFAYGANIGWVNFEALGDPEVNLLTGKMQGFAYGANVGWISLSNMFAHVQTDTLVTGPDTDGDSLPDAYELMQTNTLVTLSGLGAADADMDGSSDADEFMAGTDPLSSASIFTITDELAHSTNTLVDVTWASVPTRFYALEENTDILSTNWVDSGLGQINPDPGAETTRTVPTGVNSEKVYRVKAIKPLAP